MHASAARLLATLDAEVPVSLAVSSITRDLLYRGLPDTLVLDDTLLGETSSGGFLVSMAAGDRRVVLSATPANDILCLSCSGLMATCCSHCKAFSDWLRLDSDIAREDLGMPESFAELHMHVVAQPSPAAPSGKEVRCPVSKQRIDPELRGDVMTSRPTVYRGAVAVCCCFPYMQLYVHPSLSMRSPLCVPQLHMHPFYFQYYSKYMYHDNLFTSALTFCLLQLGLNGSFYYLFHI
jgi:hypothetical protein